MLFRENWVKTRPVPQWVEKHSHSVEKLPKGKKAQEELAIEGGPFSAGQPGVKHSNCRMDDNQNVMNHLSKQISKWIVWDTAEVQY